MIKAIFTSEKVTSSSEDAFSLYEKSCLGEKKSGKIEYSLIESLFLVSEKKMQVFQKSKLLDEQDLIKKIQRIDKKVESKLLVFSDLRKRGYIVKTALKFGADFRVYDKGIKPGQDHARWILFVTNESEQLKWHEFTAKNRIAHSTKKNLLLAIVDQESDISYYEVSWIKP